jgi:trans-aconitate 2-methyltransferase
MPWNPEVYNQFKNIRYQPFFDLMGLISPNGLEKAVDIGCGTGEQTMILSEKFEAASFLGIDPSPQMLDKSKAFDRKNITIKQATVEEFIAFNSNQQWDLIFSNAALQWSDNHPNLLPQLISLLSGKGQFAVQMPMQNDNLLNKLLLELVQEKPYADYLEGFKRESPMLSIDQYAQLLFENGLKNLQIIQKVYPIIADNEQTLFNFISGSALIPYLERLDAGQQKQFITEFKTRIRHAYKSFPAIYAFKRILLYGTSSNFSISLS